MGHIVWPTELSNKDQSSGPCHMSLDTLFVFLDEGGNFDFSKNGTQYFTITSVATTRPFTFATPLIDIRCSLLETGIGLEYFHASEDKQPVRDQVFNVISAHMGGCDSTALL